jgi:catechol 2,3-dioxygenase-like lactoylglutathione lyase family enzyme
MRTLVTTIVALILPFSARAQPPATPLVSSVGPIAITVADLDRSVRFFTRVLDFELESQEERSGDSWERTLGVFAAHTRTATLRLGDERIRLIDFLAPEGRPIPDDSRSNDRWFQHLAIAVSDMDAAYQRLRNHGVEFASSAPQTLPSWNPSAAGISAFYFKDPDHHILEIIHFPAGKGADKWHRLPANEPKTRTNAPASAASEKAPTLFLGIDHTAIVTADTDRDLAFYQSILGLRIAGHSENYGIEQERLNNVFGAHLRITTLRATTGPGIELLEYLSPTTGRDYPRDSLANDLWHWHVTLTLAPTTSLASADLTLRAARTPRVSAAPAAPDQPLSSLIVRDPDGHALLIAPPSIDETRTH